MTSPDSADRSTTPARTIVLLAELPPKALLDETALAAALGVTKRTVRRMVTRFELPPPVALAGRSTWIAERVLAHLDARAERAARKADQEARRVEMIPHRALRLEMPLESSKEQPSAAPK